jgi:hypothetical protein
MMAGPTQRKPSGGPVIPPPPARSAMPRKHRASSGRWLLWPTAFVLGVALGFGAYQWIQGVDQPFDYLLAILS